MPESPQSIFRSFPSIANSPSRPRYSLFLVFTAPSLSRKANTGCCWNTSAAPSFPLTLISLPASVANIVQKWFPSKPIRVLLTSSSAWGVSLRSAAMLPEGFITRLTACVRKPPDFASFPPFSITLAYFIPASSSSIMGRLFPASRKSSPHNAPQESPSVPTDNSSLPPNMQIFPEHSP